MTWERHSFATDKTKLIASYDCIVPYFYARVVVNFPSYCVEIQTKYCVSKLLLNILNWYVTLQLFVMPSLNLPRAYVTPVFQYIQYPTCIDVSKF